MKLLICFRRFELSVIKIHAGLRYSSFQALEWLNIDLETTCREDLTGSDDNYNHIEPRLTFKIQTKSNSSIKGAYTENYQYIHFASTSSVSLPTDLWVPSSAILNQNFLTSMR